MTARHSVSIISAATIIFSFAIFLENQNSSFEKAVLSLVIAGIAWSFGSVLCYFTASKFRSVAFFVFLASAVSAPWIGPWVFAFAFIAAGTIMPGLILRTSEDPDSLRDAFARSLLGGAVGAAVSVAVWTVSGFHALYLVAAATLCLAPLLEPRLFFLSPSAIRRWIFAPIGVACLAALPFLSSFSSSFPVPFPVVKSETTVEAPFGFDSVFQFRKDKKSDVFVLGDDVLARYGSLAKTSSQGLGERIKSLTFAHVEPQLEYSHSTEAPEFKGMEVIVRGGAGRRRLAGETRRFDLIQVIFPPSTDERRRPIWGASSDTLLTVESFRLYFDRLKDDGFIQISGELDAATAASTLATLAEAWKKSSRGDIDLHAVAVTNADGTSTRSVVLRMKPLAREERDRLGEILKVGDGPDNSKWSLVSDASGSVLTDDRPFLKSPFENGIPARTVFWGAVLSVLLLIFWVTLQERRKGVISRWQTASIATYFAGLGLSFAFFQTYFVLRAVRGWGMPIVSLGLVLAALFVSRAAGAALLPGHAKRRYGVRIQPLGNFVFAVIFTYLGSLLFEPLVATGSEWISAFVGMTVVIPFGLLGGAFLPNALEEASDKLAPRVLALLWALYIGGTSVGIYGATVVGLENGLDVAFLAGLFCFAWVAIFSGLVRPWNVRKSGEATRN